MRPAPSARGSSRPTNFRRAMARCACARMSMANCGRATAAQPCCAASPASSTTSRPSPRWRRATSSPPARRSARASASIRRSSCGRALWSRSKSAAGGCCATSRRPKRRPHATPSCVRPLFLLACGLDRQEGSPVSLDQNTLAQAAERLQQAQRTRLACRQFSLDYPEMTIDDAYAIQHAWMQLELRNGRTIKGHKIGLTSKAMQGGGNLAEPDSGTLLDDMFYRDGAVIESERFLQLKIEAELAFVLAKPLAGPDCTLFDVLDAPPYDTPPPAPRAARRPRTHPPTPPAPPPPGPTPTVLPPPAETAATPALGRGGRPSGSPGGGVTSGGAWSTSN